MESRLVRLCLRGASSLLRGAVGLMIQHSLRQQSNNEDHRFKGDNRIEKWLDEQDGSHRVWPFYKHSREHAASD